MATTTNLRAIWTDVVLRRIAGGDASDDLPIQMQDVAAALDSAMSDAIELARAKDRYFQIPGYMLKRIECLPYSTHTVECSCCKKPKKYIDEPLAVLRLRNDTGVYRAEMENGGLVARVAPDYLQNFGNLEALKMMPNPVFWVEGTRIWFHDLPDGMDVTLVVVPSALNYSDDDPIALLAGYEGVIMDSVEGRLRTMLGTQRDVTNDKQYAA